MRSVDRLLLLPRTFFLMVALLTSFRLNLKHVAAAAARSGSRNAASTIVNNMKANPALISASASDNNKEEKKYRVVQVHVIHRHGDRSPITPLRDEDFWSEQLIPETLRSKLDATTQLVRSSKHQHSASGQGPFGKLTQLGLFQMVQLGTTLREQLIQQDAEDTYHKEGTSDANKLFNERTNPMHHSKMEVWSTDFPRTIQSVQGTLMGLFPHLEGKIMVDVQHTDIMIPDPQPRRTKEQQELESTLSKSLLKLQKREEELKAVKEQVQQLLAPFVAANVVRPFGIGTEKVEQGKKRLLSWSQLSEITKCLALRDKLPSTFTPELQQVVTDHTAWRWFHLFRHPRLAHLAMHSFCYGKIVKEMLEFNTNNNDTSKKQLFLYSAHDSTLIGMLCALHLQQAASWPDYASYLKLELVQCLQQPTDNTRDNSQQLKVRCFFNDEPLQFEWCNSEDDAYLIPLELLANKLDTIGSSPEKEH
mmetsp:Transcript_27886/g.41158  ORF Transcript_27886/g.41158 Transcript_27886/m.41158 type:complete len:477 (-) Transcript_27886:71-1501(-)